MSQPNNHPSSNLQILNDFELPSDYFSLGSLSSQDQKQIFPLASVQIHSQILENLADIEIIQSFHNPYDQVIEAVYTFPMPGAAAVYDFEIKFAERIIKGQIQERDTARQAYQKALESGFRTALLEQERDDVFSLQVGNIPPGENIQIKLKLCQILDFRDQGLYELRLPTVFAPRYESEINPPRLAPGVDAHVSFELKIELLLSQGQSLIQLQSSQHLVETSYSATKICLELSQAKERLNRDFVLRWRVQSEALTSIPQTIQSQLYWMNSGFGLLQLSTAMSPAQLSTQRDLIFLVDRSGSMGEFNMASASRACSILLDSLSSQDRFAILAFDDQMEWLKSETIWLNANEDGRAKGRQFLNKLQSRGGTELFVAIEDSLKHIRKRPKGTDNLPILVILTDGQVGDESRILKTIQKQLGEALVYTIGLDVAVNDSFLGRLAQLGGGTSVCVSPGEKLDQALQSIAKEIGYPTLQSLTLDLPELTPDPIPDLYQGRSLSLLFKGPQTERLTLNANHLQQNLQQTDLQLNLQTQLIDFPCLAQLWAKSRIRDLEDQYRLAKPDQQSELKDHIISLSVKYQIICRFTAWIAIDQSEQIKDTADRIHIVQPIEDPQELNFAHYTGAVPPPPVCPSPMMAPASVLRSIKNTFLTEASPQKQTHTHITIAEPVVMQLIQDFAKQLRLLLELLNDLPQESLTIQTRLEDLKQARIRLIEALSESDIAQNMPALQSLLRKDSPRLIKALENQFALETKICLDDITQILILCETQNQRFQDEYNLKLRMI